MKVVIDTNILISKPMITPQQTNALAQELLSQLPALIGDEAAAELTAQLTPLLAEPPDRSYLQVLALLTAHPAAIQWLNDRAGEPTLITGDTKGLLADTRGFNPLAGDLRDDVNIRFTCPQDCCTEEEFTQSPLEPAPLCEKHGCEMERDQTTYG